MITLRDYLQAERELDVQEMKTGWKIHATVYAVVMTGLIVLNVLLIALTSEDFVWFPFPLVGWGASLTVHYFFAVRRADAEVRKHQAEIEQLAEHKANA